MHAARGTFAALAALAVAVALKLECPYWAAMTAVIVIQPTRGLLLEKSCFRLMGTAVGSGAGLLMLLASRSPLMITVLLSFWLAACVGIGNLLYGLRSYGALVAAFTGAVIAMAGYANPPHLNDLVFGRISCIVIGIIVSTTVTLFFTRRCAQREMLDRLTGVARTELEWIALLVRGGEYKKQLALRQDILMEITDIESSLDSAWAGSLDLKQRKRRINSLIVSLLSLLEAGTLAGDHLTRSASGIPDSWRESLARQLEESVRSLDKYGSTRLIPSVPAELGMHFPLLGETLHEMLNSLHLLTNTWDTIPAGAERPVIHPVIRHRDWLQAGRAALRASCAIAAVGMTWHFTGWEEGPLMLMATSIMVSIFSTHDRPAVLLNHIFVGASMGVAAALFCRLVLLPGLSTPLLQGIICVPVLMICILALNHHRTARGAMDAMLFFLFVLQPGLPGVPAPAAFVAGGFAALGGIGVAIFSFRFLLPVDPCRRLRSILLSIVTDLRRMAATDSLPVIDKCRARMHHRVLRMLANVRKTDTNPGALIDGGLAALAIGRCLQRLKEAEKSEGLSSVASGALQKATIRLAAAIQRPDEILSILEHVSSTLVRAQETHFPPYGSSVHSLPPAVPDEQDFASKILFIGREESQCHI